jgi:AcrR family transcriptional regulator
MAKFNRRAAERPTELLDAALEQFFRVGFSGAKIEEIARAAGVTVGTVYRYFPSKEALFRAVVERHLDISWSRGRDVAEAYGTMTAREVVALLLERWEAVLQQAGPRRVAIVVMREAPLFPETAKLYETELLTRGRLSFERALRHGIERGEFPLLPIEATARALIGAPLEQLLWDETFGSLGDAGVLGALIVRGLPRLEQLQLDAPPAASPRPAIEPVAPGTLRITTLRPPGSD